MKSANKTSNMIFNYKQRDFNPDNEITKVKAFKSTSVTNSIDSKSVINEKTVVFEENERTNACGCKQDIRCIIY